MNSVRGGNKGLVTGIGLSFMSKADSTNVAGKHPQVSKKWTLLFLTGAADSYKQEACLRNADEFGQ